MTFSPDGKELLIGGTDNRVTLINLKNREETIIHTQGKDDPDTIITKDNNTIYTYAITMIDPQPKIHGVPVPVFGYGYTLEKWVATKMPDGSIEYGPYYRGLEGDMAENQTTRKLYFSLASSQNPLWGITIKPADPKANHNTLWAWSGADAMSDTQLKGHTKDVICAAWSKDGSTIVTGDVGGKVYIWDAKTFKMKGGTDFYNKRICAVDVTADGKRMAVATTSSAVVGSRPKGERNIKLESVYVWDVAAPPDSMEPIALPKDAGQAFHGVANIKFSPDSKTLAACFCNCDQLESEEEIVGNVRIWDLQPKE